MAHAGMAAAVPPIRRPLAELSRAEQTALLDLSLEEELRELGRAGTAEFGADDGLEWVTGAFPGATVYRTSLDAAAANARLAARLAAFDARRLPVTWWVRPDARPADLGERLARHGFDLGDDEAGMAADLDGIVGDLPRPAGLTLEHFGRDRDLPADGVEAWLEVAGSSFGWLPERYEIRRRLYHSDARQPRPWRHTVARLAGRPVAMARVLLACGVAMVHGVATIPSERRQGIGSAITVAALVAARDEGYRIAVLQASSMGQGPYRRIGFETVARYGRYERPTARAPAV